MFKIIGAFFKQLFAITRQLRASFTNSAIQNNLEYINACANGDITFVKAFDYVSRHTNCRLECLFLACNSNNDELIKYLIKYDFDYGYAIHGVCSAPNDNFELYQYLEQHLEQHSAGICEFDQLFETACESGNLKIVKHLVETNRVSIETFDMLGTLYFFKHINVVKYVFSKSSKLTQENINELVDELIRNTIILLRERPQNNNDYLDSIKYIDSLGHDVNVCNDLLCDDIVLFLYDNKCYSILHKMLKNNNFHSETKRKVNKIIEINFNNNCLRDTYFV